MVPLPPSDSAWIPSTNAPTYPTRSNGSGGQSDMPFPGVSNATTSRSVLITLSRASYSTEEEGVLMKQHQEEACFLRPLQAPRECNATVQSDNRHNLSSRTRSHRLAQHEQHQALLIRLPVIRRRPRMPWTTFQAPENPIPLQ